MALVLFSIVGQCVMVTANELVMIFIGLEISIVVPAILAGYWCRRRWQRNNELASSISCWDRLLPRFCYTACRLMYVSDGIDQSERYPDPLSGGHPGHAGSGRGGADFRGALRSRFRCASCSGWAPDNTRARRRRFPHSSTALDLRLLPSGSSARVPGRAGADLRHAGLRW